MQWADSDTSDHWHEQPLLDDDLESLQTEIEDLINDVVESELNDEIKRVLIDGLDAVRNAVLQYRVRGAEGIRQALDRNIGLMARYGQELKTASETDEGRIISRWWGFLQKVDTMLSLALNVPQLAAPGITQWMLTAGS